MFIKIVCGLRSHHEAAQGCSQDFHEGGAQFNGIGIVRGVAAHGQLCWP